MSLPINFHKTFIPERRLIGALLQFAAREKIGDYQAIAVDTGIPMGESNGKVPAILDYASGMGLIKLESSSRSSVKKPNLTEFGRIVFLQDKYLSEQLTQWIAHMHLCRPDIGAQAWYYVFGRGQYSLGKEFNAEQLERYLVTEFGPGRSRTGPMIRAYEDDAALGRIKALSRESDIIKRNKAPLLQEYALPYTAYILSLLDNFFPESSQVTTNDLNEKAAWFETCLWDRNEISQALALVERTGYITIDRQMQPWIIERRSRNNEIWSKIYDDLP